MACVSHPNGPRAAIVARGGKRPGAGRPKRDAPRVYRSRVILAESVGELVRQYAEAEGITEQQAIARLVELGLVARAAR